MDHRHTSDWPTAVREPRGKGGSGLPLHVHKKAVRALGIAESFVKGVSERSVLAGVVMRADRVLDGFGFATATVGGMDATDTIIKLYATLERDDINVLLLNGCIISWYNVIDLHQVVEETRRPLLCVTYEASEGLDKYFLELFPDDGARRVEVYHKNGSRTPITLQTGHTVYTRFINMSLDDAKGLLNKFTMHGAVPEPLRVARLLARSLVKARPQTGF
jgi:endonuclease V-like protein UPF0215 family